MSDNPLTARLRPHVQAIMADAEAGNARAKEVITLYRMYCACPADHGASALCEAAFEAWQKDRRP